MKKVNILCANNHSNNCFGCILFFETIRYDAAKSDAV